MCLRVRVLLRVVLFLFVNYCALLHVLFVIHCVVLYELFCVCDPFVSDCVMLNELFCAVCCVCVLEGLCLMCLCHLFVVYFVMLHCLFVCVFVCVCVFARFVCVFVFCV